MNENSEMWRDYKEATKQKKKSNESNSLAMLKAKGIEVKILNEHVSHYRVGEFDYWPTTGKFYNQKTGQKGRGVFSLLTNIKRD